MIDVVTLNYRHPEYLDRSLPSMIAQGVPFTGWLWDNSETAAAKRTASRYDWRYLTVGHNLSYSEAHNRAVAEGEAPWLLLLNDDAALHPGAVRAMLDHDADVCGALILHSRGSVNHAGGKLDGLMPDHIGRFTAKERWVGRCEPCAYVTFAAVLIRRTVWDELGGLDEGYVYGFEDTDFCFRAREAGREVMVCRDALVTHDELGTRNPALNVVNADRFRRRWLMNDRAERIPA